MRDREGPEAQDLLQKLLSTQSFQRVDSGAISSLTLSRQLEAPVVSASLLPLPALPSARPSMYCELFMSFGLSAKAASLIP